MIPIISTAQPLMLTPTASVNPDLPMLNLGEPLWLVGLLGVALLGLVSLWLGLVARRRLRAFADDARLADLLRAVSPTRRWFKLTLVLLSISLLIVTLAQPESDPVETEVVTQGRDIVFVVDVSRSMLASDLSPNRLDRSKLWIKDLVANLEGDRVGLVAFAGAAVVKCPLTLDRKFFNLALDELSPSSAPVGGTYIGDAIRKAMNSVFLVGDLPDRESENGDGNGDTAEPVRDIILITDGDDQDSFPVEASAVAGQAGIRVIAIGVGSEGRGATVPDPHSDGVLHYLGQPVRSSLNAAALAEIATASAGGLFLNVGTGEIDLAQIDRDLNAIDARTDTGTSVTVEYQPRFYIPLSAALLLIVIEPLVSDRTRRRRTPEIRSTA
ncbi:MAG: Ca-activated chloride channel family protein [Phycisphaerales bacterium]|jgi:Ca-activated chloride channel family protein